MDQNNLEELKTNLKSKLCLKSVPIDRDGIEQILNNSNFTELIEVVLLKIDEDDTGTNV